MRVAVTGATGSIGRGLVPVLQEGGHEVVALTRSAATARDRLGSAIEIRETDIYSSSDLVTALAGCGGIVHLAGEPIFGKRWGKNQRKVVYDSRVATTRAIVQAIHDLSPRPKVFVCSSAVGFYGARPPEEAVDESAVDAAQFAPTDFLAWVCRDWEQAAAEVERFGVRCVRARIGVVLTPGEGVLGRMEKPFRLGLGGAVGSGKQVISWIHEEDLCRLLLLALDRQDVAGPLNATAPNPVSNGEFSKALARALGRPCLLRVPSIALRLQLGKAAQVVTTGQRVLPAKALRLGFRFHYPTIDAALAQVYGGVKASKTPVPA
jgi:uncharacterized protein (TIGR01777 family)